MIRSAQIQVVFASLALFACSSSWAAEDGMTDLQRAVVAGNLGKVVSLIGDEVNVHEPGPRKMKAVHYAAEGGYAAILEVLLEAGAHPDLRNEDSQRPLHLAANSAVAERLVEAGASVNESVNLLDPSSLSPLSSLCRITPLYLAVAEGRTDVVRVLIERGATVDPFFEVSPLIWAVFYGQAKTVDVLLKAGADPNRQAPYVGGSPLHVAAAGAFTDMNSPAKATPEVRLSIARALIEAGADVNAMTGGDLYSSFGFPLVAAAMEGQVALVMLLLENGAEVNIHSNDGYWAGFTALHGAGERGHRGVVMELLKAGADVTATTGKEALKKDAKALDLAKSEEIRALLMKAD